MTKLKISAIAFMLSIFSLMTSCNKDSEKTIEDRLENKLEQSVSINIAPSFTVANIPALELDKKDDFRALEANLNAGIDQGLKFKYEGDLKVLMILRKSGDANMPYFYKVITAKQKSGGTEKSEFITDAESHKFEWPGDRTFEQLKSERWEVMFFLSKNIAALATDNSNRITSVGSTSANQLAVYTAGQDSEITGLDVPFFSKWEVVTFEKNTGAKAGEPTYKMKIGDGLDGHTMLNPQGVVVRAQFDNKINLPVTVEGFKVETNAYAFEGSYDLSKAALESNGGIPQYSQTLPNASTNVKGEACYTKTFALASPFVAEKNVVSDKECLFWITPLATPLSGSAYTQIYLNASVAGHTPTNANGNIADDTANALKGKAKGGMMDHGAVANVPVPKHAPSMRCLPVLFSQNTNYASKNGVGVHTTLIIERPKTILEHIAETHMQYNNGDVTPDATGTFFATDLTYSSKAMNMFTGSDKSNIRRNPNYPIKWQQWWGGTNYSDWDANATDKTSLKMMDRDKNHLSLKYTKDHLKESTDFAADYKIPTTRAWYGFCITPNDNEYQYDGVKLDSHSKKNYYATFKSGNFGLAQNYTSWMSGWKNLGANGRVQYAMRYVDVDGNKYRVVARYYQFDGEESPNQWDVNINAGNPDFNGASKIRNNAYHSVTFRYLGANYGFLKNLDEGKYWANEDFWKTNNEDDIVRYYPRYGYAWDATYHAQGIRGLYWIDQFQAGHNAPEGNGKCFAIDRNGWRGADDGGDHHYLYRSDEGNRQSDNAPCLLVTERGWGE